MGAKPTTITGLSGTGDIMLTCFVNLSRNRTVGVRLGSGEKLEDILNSMNQVVLICALSYAKLKWQLLKLTSLLPAGSRRCLNGWSCDCFGTKV